MRRGANTMVERLFYTPQGQVIVSIILALGLAMLFRKVCKDRKCYVIRAPTPEIMNKVYKQDDDVCYKYVARNVPCE